MSTISINKLRTLLAKSKNWLEKIVDSEEDIIYISFADIKSQLTAVDTIDYTASDGRIINVDVNGKGEVIGIEIY